MELFDRNPGVPLTWDLSPPIFNSAPKHPAALQNVMSFAHSRGADRANSSRCILKLGGARCCFSCCLNCSAANSFLSPSGDVIEVYYGDNRFGTVSDSGTATLKPRPRVRPLLTFLPLVSIRLSAAICYGSMCNWCPEPAGLAAALILYPRQENK